MLSPRVEAFPQEPLLPALLLLQRVVRRALLPAAGFFLPVPAAPLLRVLLLPALLLPVQVQVRVQPGVALLSEVPVPAPPKAESLLLPGHSGQFCLIL
ncbi:hypothetical protein D9M69_704700 [compost metagenome]